MYQNEENRKGAPYGFVADNYPLYDIYWFALHHKELFEYCFGPCLRTCLSLVIRLIQSAIISTFNSVIHAVITTL